LLWSWHTRSDNDNFWQKCYWESKKSDDGFRFPTSPIQCFCITLRQGKPHKRAYWCIVCTTQSICCSVIDFVYPAPCPQQPRAQCIDYKIQRVIQQHEYESWVKKIEEIKQLVEFRQCTDIAFEQKMQFSCFPVLLGSAETQVIWCGVVKCLWLLTLSLTFLPKYVKIRSCVKVKQAKGGTFFETRWNYVWNNYAVFRWLIRL